jgi:hypothetical protein
VTDSSEESTTDSSELNIVYLQLAGCLGACSVEKQAKQAAKRRSLWLIHLSNEG